MPTNINLYISQLESFRLYQCETWSFSPWGNALSTVMLCCRPAFHVKHSHSIYKCFYFYETRFCSLSFLFWAISNFTSEFLSRLALVAVDQMNWEWMVMPFILSTSNQLRQCNVTIKPYQFRSSNSGKPWALNKP